MPTLEDEIRSAIRGLTHTSDSPNDHRFYLISSPNQKIEVRGFDEWFEPRCRIGDWMTNAEIALAFHFRRVKNLLEEKLTDLRVVKIGRVQVDIYIVGRDSHFNIVGIKTKAIES